MYPENIREVSYAPTSEGKLRDGKTLKIADDQYTKYGRTLKIQDWNQPGWKNWDVGEKDVSTPMSVT